MDKHISLARELGYKGQELRDYLKRQQDLEREERVAQREYEREKREAERLRLEAEQKEKIGSKKRKIGSKKIRIGNLKKMRLEYAQREKDKQMEKEVELKQLRPKWNSKRSRPRPLHIPGGLKRKVQILGVPSFHTLTNIWIRWIATYRGSKVMPFQINGTRLCGHRI